MNGKLLTACLVVVILITILPFANAEALVKDGARIITNESALNERLQEFSNASGVIIYLETFEELEEVNATARTNYKRYDLDKNGKPMFNLYIVYVEKSNELKIGYGSKCGLNLNNLKSAMDSNDVAGKIAEGEYDEAFSNLIDRLKVIVDKALEETEGGTVCIIPSTEVSGNEKDMSLYTDKTVFLVSDENWRDVMGIVPVAIWKRNEEKYSYPLLIYHKEGEVFDADSILLFLEQYKTERIIIVGDYPQGLLNSLSSRVGGAGNIQKIEPEEYKNFWEEYEQVVVSENDYKTAMIASIYAYHYNAPLFIANGIPDAGNIVGKKIICIGSVSGVSCTQRYTLDELQSELIKQRGPKKLLLINPKDIQQEYCESKLQIKGKPNFKNWYCKMSLSAPHFAAGKDWIIGFAETDPAPGMLKFFESDYTEYMKEIKRIKEQLKSMFGTIYLDIPSPTHILFLAAPIAMPLSEVQLTVGGNSRLSIDRSLWSGPVGRVYTKTITGISAYLNRILFNMRNDQNTFLGIAHSMPEYQSYFTNLKIQLPKLGYATVCYLDYDPLNVCKPDVPSPPYDEYKGQKIIYFNDHGISEEWTSTIHAKDLPYLDSSIIISDSCSTNDYYSSTHGYVFGPESLEKGALAYFGAVGYAQMQEGFTEVSSLGEDLLIFIMHDDGYDLGTALFKTYKDYDKYGGGLEKFSDFILMGDPTLKPNIPRFSYPFIINHNIPKIAVKPFKVNFEVSDIKGANNIGQIKTLVRDIETGSVREKVAECEMDPRYKIDPRFNKQLCTSAEYEPMKGNYLFEIRAFEPGNKYYGSVFSTIKTGPIIASGINCELVFVGTENLCFAEIAVKQNDFDKAILIKEAGGAIEPTNFSVVCNWNDDAEKYYCEIRFIPKEVSEYKFKLLATTKPINGKVHRDESTTAIKANYISIIPYTCENVALGTKEIQCKFDIAVKQKDYFDKAILIKEAGGAIEPTNPAVICNWNDNTEIYDCKINFIPKEAGLYKFKLIATTKPINGKVHKDEKTIQRGENL